MDLSVKTLGPWAPENFSWLGSAHGTDSTETITLVVSLFTTTFGTQGYIPSGVGLGKITSVGATQNMYGPYSDAAADGRQVMVGHLMTSKSISTGVGTYIGAALLTHGKVRLSNLPTG